MEAWIEIVQTVGFPIACTLALGFMLFKLAQRWIDDAHEREESLGGMNERLNDGLKKVADTILESNCINKELSETNRMLVDKVENNLSALNSNVGKILDKISCKYDSDDKE